MHVCVYNSRDKRQHAKSKLSLYFVRALCAIFHFIALKKFKMNCVVALSNKQDRRNKQEKYKEFSVAADSLFPLLAFPKDRQTLHSRFTYSAHPLKLCAHSLSQRNFVTDLFSPYRVATSVMSWAAEALNGQQQTAIPAPHPLPAP